MMTMKGRLALACIVIVAGGLTVGYAEDTPEIASNLPVTGECAVKCVPGTYLDDATCTCTEFRPFKGECALVCVKPWQQLDALNCRCVGTNLKEEFAN